jgi:DNA-binding transcriptional LysR family regulator
MIGRTVSFKELVENSLVVRIGSIILDELVKLGWSPNMGIQCEAPEAVKAAVYKGLGVGVLHRESVEHDLKTGVLKTIHVPELEKLQVRSYYLRRT